MTYLFFLGHGFGIEADQTNYLLLGDIRARSPIRNYECRRRTDASTSFSCAWARSWRPINGMRFRAAYLNHEVNRWQASSQETRDHYLSDACRSLLAVAPSGNDEVKQIVRGPTSGGAC